MQAILTKYHPATETKPARISVRAGQNRVKFYSRDAIEDSDNRFPFVRDYCRSLGWSVGELVGKGTLPNGDIVYTFSSDEKTNNPAMVAELRRRLALIEGKYSTEDGATKAEHDEAKILVRQIGQLV